jgi:hypothetical protein
VEDVIYASRLHSIPASGFAGLSSQLGNSIFLAILDNVPHSEDIDKKSNGGKPWAKYHREAENNYPLHSSGKSTRCYSSVPHATW